MQEVSKNEKNYKRNDNKFCNIINSNITIHVSNTMDYSIIKVCQHTYNRSAIVGVYILKRWKVRNKIWQLKEVKKNKWNMMHLLKSIIS